MVAKRLYRSRHDRVLAGIFGGLGEYFETDPVLWRLAWIVVLVVTAFIPGVIIYLISIFIIPLKPEEGEPKIYEAEPVDPDDKDDFSEWEREQEKKDSGPHMTHDPFTFGTGTAHTTPEKRRVIDSW